MDICAAWRAEILGFAIAIPVAASALARPVGFLDVLLLNNRFFPPPSFVDMIEAVSSSCPFFGESHELDPPPPPPLLVGLAELGAPADDAVPMDAGDAVNSGCLSMVGDSTMGVMVTFVLSGSA